MSRFIFAFAMFFVLIASDGAFAFRKSSECLKAELKLKNCALEFENFKLHFTHDKILIHDGVWRGIEDFPIVGEGVEWESVKIAKMGHRFIIQIELWDQPKGDLAVQSLQWLVLEIKGNKLQKQLQKVVQKRNPIFGDTEKKKYKLDQKIDHSLSLKKEKSAEQIIWKYRFESGTF